jgi:hypothetical protein
MSEQHCPECGKENPGEARFCMHCGTSLIDRPAPVRSTSTVEGTAGGAGLYVPSPGQSPAPAVPAQEKATDWAAIAAAILALLSLRHMSRRARDTFLVIAFLILFFGCPMVCGTVAFVMQWSSNLFH